MSMICHMSINYQDLPNDLKSECKLFADDTSLFAIAHNANTSESDIKKNLNLIRVWAFQ